MSKADSFFLRLYEGDPRTQPWSSFYQLYANVVLGYAVRLGLNAKQAEDVLQETILTLLRMLPHFRSDHTPSIPGPKLLSIIHHRIHASLRRSEAASNLQNSGLERELPKPPKDPDPEQWKLACFEHALNQVRTEKQVPEHLIDELSSGNEPSEALIAALQAKLNEIHKGLEQNQLEDSFIRSEWLRRMNETHPPIFVASQNLYKRLDFAGEMLEKTTGIPNRPVLLYRLKDDNTAIIPIEDGMVLGRSMHSDIVLDTPHISRRHCEFFRAEDHLFIRDCESTNGTVVNGQLVHTKVLTEGDMIELEPHLIVFLNKNTDLSMART